MEARSPDGSLVLTGGGQFEAPEGGFTGILNVPGIEVAQNTPQDRTDHTLESEVPEAGPPGSSPDNPRDATTTEIEYIRMMQATRRASVEEGVAFVAMQDLLEQLTGLTESTREEQAEQADERLSMAERRRWHAATSLCQGSGTSWSFELLGDLTRWLETGERPADKR